MTETATQLREFRPAAMRVRSRIVARVTTILTLGHSSRPLVAFVELLASCGVEALSDVRAFPGSRRFPQFQRETLAAAVEDATIEYHWTGKALGGHRTPGAGAGRHVAIPEDGFRAYAEHMTTELFLNGIARLRELAGRRRVACMCAEKDWRHCHRRLLSDHLVAIEGIEVVHVVDPPDRAPHRIDGRARIVNGQLVYDCGHQPNLF